MRRLMRRSRRSLALLLVGVAAVLVVGGASGSPTVTIGQTDPGANFSSGTPAWFVQTGVASGTDFVVPPGNWNITGWSTYAVRYRHSVDEHDGLPTRRIRSLHRRR